MSDGCVPHIDDDDAEDLALSQNPDFIDWMEKIAAAVANIDFDIEEVERITDPP